MVTDSTIYRNWTIVHDRTGICWLTFDRADSTTNSLSRDVLDELDRLLKDVADASPRALVIRSGKAGGFIVGADVREFSSIPDESEALAMSRRGQEILERIEAMPFPTIALIHGFCLGGGMELALACRYRIASDDPATRLGLPEILLGIHPGFGGTVRLIRLVGPLTGMELMLTGKTLSAKAARKTGLVDYAVPERHLENAARAVAASPAPVHQLPLKERMADLPGIKKLAANYLRKKVSKKADRRHYPAPYALIDLWQGFTGNRRVNFAAEAASVARLITGSTARNLVRVFLLQEQLKSLGRMEENPVERVHVVGGGAMGGDIAVWCALQGLKVTIQDLDTNRLGQVVKRGQALFVRILKERRAVEAAMDRLVPDPAGHGVAGADLVIEAIFENADAKRDLYRQLEPRMKQEAILATNTSSIPLQDLASALERPARLIGLHFFNPVDKMQLVEVVSSAESDPELVKRGAAFVRVIKRLPLPVTSTPGFLVNRILLPYVLEAVTMVGEGIPPAAIDRAATDFGMPMGPIRLADSVGLDICLSVATILSQHFPMEVPARLTDLVSAGHLGRKSGQGFYDYRNANKEKEPAAERTNEDVASRLMLRMLNEAVACWREGVVADADMLDAGVIFGTGFAPFRGGPMQHIAATGAASVLARMQELAAKYGSRFTPDEGWLNLTNRGTIET
jgi:3-hydroxyacyl-CoA dehydrogenase / enoyl-CoA hydratase / 3-hydroxybutyryl-CoA epimerase